MPFPLTCAVPEFLKLWQDNMKGFIKREKKPPPFLNNLIQKFLNENCLVFGPETAHGIKYRLIMNTKNSDTYVPII